jgi:hypothetical protein
MLGREEEMLEREEVERQLREVEVQERMAAEGGEFCRWFSTPFSCSSTSSQTPSGLNHD